MNQYLYTDFEEAFKLSKACFSKKELLTLLNSDKIYERQIAALNFPDIANKDEAKALLNNLIGVDGKIRESVAHTLYRILLQDNDAQKSLLLDNSSAEIFANATIDINANICRTVIDSVILLKDNIEFSSQYANKIFKFSQTALEELDKFIFRDKKYVINKQLFKLYWCLEALKNFYKFIDNSELLILLEKAAQQKEYTIREKVAQILVNTDMLPQLQERLKNDENYYVRTALN